MCSILRGNKMNKLKKLFEYIIMTLICISGLLIVGLAGGVEHGEPISNLLYSIPLFYIIRLLFKFL